MKLKTGQIVHVRATVADSDPDPYGDVRLGVQCSDGSKEMFTAAPSEIIHAEPVPLVVGEIVTWGSKAANFEILAINDGIAWLRHSVDRTFYRSEPLSQLERVP